MMRGRKKKFIYEVVRANDFYELPIYVGSGIECCRFLNTSEQNFYRRVITGGICCKEYRVFKVELIEDDEEDSKELEDG